jgi:hypothetical protein
MDSSIVRDSRHFRLDLLLDLTQPLLDSMMADLQPTPEIEKPMDEPIETIKASGNVFLDSEGLTQKAYVRGWSDSQKEAIRAELALLMGLSSVVFSEEVDGDLVKSLINKTMSAIEAITKGEQ